MKLSKLIIFGLSILDFSVLIKTNVKGWHEQKSTYNYVTWQATFIFCFSIEISVTPRPDEVHSTCNCRDAYVHQVSL